MISLWRTTPRLAPKVGRTCTPRQNDFVFPSGRQAITRSLELMSLDRKNRVALPEFSSHCLISSVAQKATPIPAKEVVAEKLNVECFLIYEQWGWKYAKSEINRVVETYSNVIFDCVDSPDFFITERDAASCHTSVVVSLSKCLGLPGGGLLRLDGKDITSESSQTTPEKSEEYLASLGSDMVKTYAKSNSHISDWLEKNDVELALAEESKDRKINLEALAASPLGANWEPWMIEAVNHGCSAGIAPLFRGRDEADLQSIKTQILASLGIASEVYNFNWLGNPQNGVYEPCLAFPVHGEVDMSKVANELEKL